MKRLGRRVQVLEAQQSVGCATCRWSWAIRRYLMKDEHVTDPRQYGEVGRSAIVDVVRTKCRLVGAAGQG